MVSATIITPEKAASDMYKIVMNTMSKWLCKRCGKRFIVEVGHDLCAHCTVDDILAYKEEIIK